MAVFPEQAAIARLLTYVEHAIPAARIGGEPGDPVLWLPAPQGYAVWVGVGEGVYVVFVSRRSQPQNVWHQYVGTWDEEPARLWPRVSGWLNAHDELNQAWGELRRASTPAPRGSGDKAVREAQSRLSAPTADRGVSGSGVSSLGRQALQRPTLMPPPHVNTGDASRYMQRPATLASADVMTRPPSTARTRKLRLIGYALMTAGVLFSLIPNQYTSESLWTTTTWESANARSVWAPFSAEAISDNTWPFVALVIFGVAGTVCLIWAYLDDRNTH